jgi:hypothetical protein
MAILLRRGIVPQGLPPALSVDGIATNTGTGNSGSVTLTTTLSNDIIVVLIACEADSRGAGANPSSVSSVTATGLSFTQRSRFHSESGIQAHGIVADLDYEVWWALAASPLSSVTISVSMTNSGGNIDDWAITAFGVNGANTSTPWDANGSLPSTANTANLSTTAPSCSGISTTAANTMIFGFAWSGSDGVNTIAAGSIGGTGATTISILANGGGGLNANNYSEYLVVTSAQSSISANFSGTQGANGGWAMYADAIQKA